MLDDLGLVDMLLPELASLKGLEQPKKHHIYDAYEHTVKAFECAPPRLRFAALLHDIGKAESIKSTGNMHSHAQIGAELADGICKRFKLPNSERKRLVKIVALHMTDVKGDVPKGKLRRFVVENFDVIHDLCDFMDADSIAHKGEAGRSDAIRRVVKEIKDDGTPLCVKDLKISGQDLVNMGVDEKTRGKILEELWLDTAENPALNDREKAIDYVENKRKDNRD